MSDDRLKTLLPLKSLEFEILLTLADGERHGYAIMTDVEERSQGLFRLHPGTLYRTVNRLLDAGLVEESEDRPDPQLDDQRRRYYRVTDFGRRVLSMEASRLEARLRLARRKGLLEDGGLA